VFNPKKKGWISLAGYTHNSYQIMPTYHSEGEGMLNFQGQMQLTNM
jgi:hypothetical protein